MPTVGIEISGVSIPDKKFPALYFLGGKGYKHDVNVNYNLKK